MDGERHVEFIERLADGKARPTKQAGIHPLASPIRNLGFHPNVPFLRRRVRPVACHGVNAISQPKVAIATFGAIDHS